MIDVHELLKTNPGLIPQSLIEILVEQAAQVEIGRMYANSLMVPKEFQGNIANCAVVVGMASRMRLDPLTLMQNVAFVSGRPTWKATFVIAMANQSRIFKSSLQFKTTGTGRQMKVTCFAERIDGRMVEETVTMEMAESDGWTKNPKYKSLPEVMLSYRAAMFFVRKNCPELLFGLPAEEEVEQQEPVTVQSVKITDGASRLASIASRAMPELAGPVAGEAEVPQQDWRASEQDEPERVEREAAEEQQRAVVQDPPAPEQQVDEAEPEFEPDEQSEVSELDRVVAEVDEIVATLKNGPERLALAAKGNGWRTDLEAARKALLWATKAAASAAAKAASA